MFDSYLHGFHKANTNAALTCSIVTASQLFTFLVINLGILFLKYVNLI